MGGISSRPFALIASLMLNFAPAPSASAQTVPQVTPTSLARKDGRAQTLELRLARPLSRAEETALRPRDRFRECVRCPEMVVVPDGVFMMGADASEAGSTEDERPRHRVSLQHFAAGRSPVTSEEWQACVAAKGCAHRVPIIAGRERDSVTGILWDEAGDYVRWLSHATGRPYRLLSEAEREYAARAGTTTAFWWGDVADPHEADAAAANLVADIGISTVAAMPPTVPLANPFGLLEVHGAVYDWVEDCWHDNYVGAPSDGSAWTAGDCKGHVLRGGALSRSLQTRRSAARMWSGPPNRMDYMSVRVARTLGP
ncbi:formylglycine-generating enzyme family protein [Bradyrhizobium sp.]|uniref:formylglycine-generating enzyme family protein n=1 Tax=Bradyrhizobium sp. TaxID=376 RepID=UPI00239D4145|nr:formylglycine-generating enzyme family protein [Bradyrhizobium sp.]MDE2376374.1 formylglycine-generating enzyme family protein [Bradyrhizobium sp.]